MFYTYLAPVSIYKKKFKGSYFQFPDFWSIFYKGKSNYRTGNDIDMKLGSATKLKKKHGNVEKFDDDKMFINCDIHVILSIHGQVGAIQNVCKSVKHTFSKTVTFYFIKIENSVKQISNSSYTIADISEIKGVLVLGGNFLKLHMCVYLRIT